jgi:hypothetical protein
MTGTRLFLFAVYGERVGSLSVSLIILLGVLLGVDPDDCVEWKF